jgi:hypothetical protein
MPAIQFDRDEMAGWYARRHLTTDPAIRVLYYLPAGAPEREIRFLEVNDQLAVREDDPMEPIDFGVDIDGADPHSLTVLDVTPAQWEKIHNGILSLPNGWSLDGAVTFSR